MHCRKARKLLFERSLGSLTRALAAGLDGHLSGCADCSTHAEAEAELTAALGLLRVEAPMRVDVSDRVLAQVDAVRPGDLSEFQARPYGWATAAALAGGVFLAWALWELSPGLPGVARQFGAVLAAAKPLLGGVADPIVTVASALGRLIVNLAVAAAHVLRSVKPIGITALVSAVVMMASTVALLVARDFRKSTPIREDYR